MVGQPQPCCLRVSTTAVGVKRGHTAVFNDAPVLFGERGIATVTIDTASRGSTTAVAAARTDAPPHLMLQQTVTEPYPSARSADASGPGAGASFGRPIFTSRSTDAGDCVLSGHVTTLHAIRRTEAFPFGNETFRAPSTARALCPLRRCRRSLDSPFINNRRESKDVVGDEQR
jgi:hypothetical protein